MTAALPRIPEPPAGVEAIPELGDGVLGARFRKGWVLAFRIGAGLSLALTILLCSVIVTGRDGSLSGDIVAVVVIALTGACTLGLGVLAWFGTRPVLTFDADRLHHHLPLSRFSVEWEAISEIRPGRRDIFVRAAGGISTAGKVWRRRWVVLSNTGTLEVEHPRLAAYLADRAAAARAAG